MAKREGLKKQEKKSNLLFDVLKDIKTNKKGTLLNNEGDSSVSNFMLLKFLSMDNGINLEIAETLNQYQGVLSKKQMYSLLCEIVPKDNSYSKFISNKKSKIEGCELVAKYFDISTREASEYLKIHGSSLLDEISKKFGGKNR